MKKGTLRFIGLAMGLCLVVPLAACTNKPAEQDTTEYKISITNKAELQGEWSVAHGGRKVSVSVEPEANVTDLVQSGAITFASSNEAVIKFIGQMAQPQAAGSAKLTVEYKGAKDEVDVTIIEKATEPAVVEATPSQVMAAEDTDGAKKYHVVGYVVSWGSKDAINEYGEMRVGDTAETKAADAMYVYGSFADKGTKAGFEWTGVKYTVAYDRDFLKNDLTKNLHIGDKVEMYVIRTDYGSTKEVKGQVLSVEKGAYVAATGLKIQLNKKDADAASVFAQEHLLLTSVVEPSNASDEIVWSAEDATVASVENGWVKGLKAGTTKIIATANADVKAELTLTVAAERTITNDGSEAHPFTVEEACSHVARLEDNNKYENNEIYVEGVIITSSYSADYANYTIWLADENDSKAFELYATVISDSVLAAASLEAEAAQKSNGLKGYKITAHGYAKNMNNTLELGNYKADGENYSYPTATALVKAPSVPATAIALDKEEAEVAVGSKITLNANLTPFYSEDAVTWLSSDSTKATVASGVVTGVAAGEVTITAFLDANENGAKDEGELFAQAAITVTLNNTLKITVDNTGIGATALTEKLEKTYQIKDGNVVVEFSSGSKDKANYSEFMIPKNGGYIKVNSIPSTLKIDYVDIDFYKYPDNTKVYAAADASSEEALVTGTEQPSSSFTDSKVRRFAIDGENFYLANPSTYDVNFFSITIVLVAKAA